MIYVVFALIVAAALAYLFFADNRGVRYSPVHTDMAHLRLIERREAVRISLRDLDYEKSVGKIDADNFSLLQNALLLEWDQIEQELNALPRPAEAKSAEGKRCPGCGTEVLAAAARFCHACGAKLPQVFLAFLFWSALLSASPAVAYDIRVTVQNGTAGRLETSAISVQLLKLEQGMQPVQKKNATGGRVEFLQLPEMTSGPYMVQTEYQDVTYSRVVPPNMASPAEVVLEVFESTSATEKLRVRTLVELRRTEKNTLTGLMILFFVNRDTRTFTGGKTGLEFFLPAGAEIGGASISVGSGTSNIQWLKLEPRGTKRANVYSVGQNVKPGDRILQISFRMPYDEKGTALDFRSLYPQDAGIQLIAEPDDMQVFLGEKTLRRTLDENLGRGLIGFRPHETALALRLVGGGIAPSGETREAEIEILSPLATWQKLVFPAAALAAFLGVGALRRRRRVF